jgi:hypothetical protein
MKAPRFLGRLAACVTLFSVAVAQTPPADPPPPKLVVLIVVDQFRPDYLERFAPRFEGFFAQLRDEGRWFTEGEQHHAVTVTAAGHASLGTGRFPSHHGIVDNEFYDAAARRMVGAANDGTAGPVGGIGGGYSAARLRCDGLADWWRKRWPAGRTIGIAGKPRSAILALGHPEQAWWIDEQGKGIVTSAAFVRELPAWVVAFGEKSPIADYPQSWEATLPDDAAYAALGCTGDDQAGEAPIGPSRAFPHPLGGQKPANRILSLLHSPWGDELLLEFARAAIEAEQLGGDDSPDLLLLGLSSTDYVGHRYGPDSWEICEQVLHLDRALADFLSFAESKAGEGRVLVALSADHGVCPLPEVAAARGKAGDRVDWTMLQPAIDAALLGISPALAGAAIPSGEFGFRLDRAKLAAAGLELEKVAPALAAVLRGRSPFVDVRSQVELAQPLAPDDRLGELMRNSAGGERSGDLLFALPAGSIYLPPPLKVATGAAILATSHGSANDYDRAVPIVFLGAGVQPGRVGGRAWSVDVAPTLALAVGAPLPPDLDGRPLPLAGAATR